jgi:solute carrier family 45, member 1/2/4
MWHSIRFTWGMEMSYCTPYLLHLGLTKSTISLVWIAGPVSGLIMQPLIGIIADRNTSSWGRRRPFMMFGCVIVAAFLLALGRAEEIVNFFMGVEPGNKELRRSLSIWLAVLSIIAIDFSINAGM